MLPLWDSEAGKGFIATLRSILSGNNITDVSILRSYSQDVITAEVSSRVDDPPGSGRVREQIVDTIAPNLQRYLTGELPQPSED